MIKVTISSEGAGGGSSRTLSARRLTGGGWVGADRAEHFMKGGRKSKTGATTVGAL